MRFHNLAQPVSLHMGIDLGGRNVSMSKHLLDGAEVVAFYEVKGAHIHNAASLRAFKEARSAFTQWRFIFAQKFPSGWTTAE